MRDGDKESIERLGKFTNQKNTNIIGIPLDEYKELLIIKGKYEELSKRTEILHNTGEHAYPYGPSKYCDELLS